MRAEPPEPDARDPKRWGFRGYAAAILLAQVLVTVILYPPPDRFTLHPDDRDTYIYGKQIMKSGLPAIPRSSFDPLNLSKIPVLARASCRLTPQDECASPRAPGVFYLMAPFTSDILTAHAGAQAVSVAMEFVFFLYLQRKLGGGSALVGLVAFAGSACTVFWSTFMMSNVPAVGVFFGGLLLLDRDTPWASGLGAGIMALSVLMRQDYLILVAVFGVAWLVLKMPGHIKARRWGMVAGVVGGFTLGAAAVASLCLRLYGTVNFIAVSRKTDTAVASSVTKTLGHTHLDVIERNIGLYLLLFLIYFLGLVGLAWSRKRWPNWPLAAAGVVMAAYFLSTGFAVQIFFMSNSYTRYMIPVIAFGSYGIAQLWGRLSRPERLLIGAVLIMAVAASVVVLASKDGYVGAENVVAEHQKLAAMTDSLPKGAVLAAEFDYSEKTPVVHFSAFKAGATRQKEIPKVFASLLDKGRLPLIYEDNKGLAVRAILEKDGRFMLKDYPGNSRIQQVQYR